MWNAHNNRRSDAAPFFEGAQLLSTVGLTVRTKLAATFGGLAGFFLIVAGLSLYSANGANERFNEFVNGLNARARMAESVRSAVDRRAIAAYNLLLVSTVEDLATEEAAVYRANKDVTNRLDTLTSLVAETPDNKQKARELVADIDRIEHRYGPFALETARMTLHGQGDVAISQMNAIGRPLLSDLVKASDAYLDFANSEAKAQINAASEAFAFQRFLLLSSCAFALAAAASASVLITRGLTRQLGAEPAELGRIAQRVAQGDLRVVDVIAEDGSVLESLVRMQNGLSEMVLKVRRAADAIAVGSHQIAMGNADLSRRTDEQASALEQVAAAMDQLGSTVQANAHSAQQADEMAKSTSGVASKGGILMSNVVDTMKGINASSTRIADIIALIDDIAFQTNILALNAAVEAARAGGQGRGFAVVASEVRALAQRSATAAQEIKSLIANSVDQVGKGTGLVDRAGHTMAEIVGATKRVSDIVGEITIATVEQNSGLAQVGSSVWKMDRVTQQNSALVEQSALATNTLAQQAQDLLAIVAAFRLAPKIEDGHANQVHTD